ncbi:hypothetical protein PVAND_013836 [Polypedilum vanderplanki]|uniref:Uncharacterized protein n=1 Tax=Polypedilum vanderplanki TaxID=319348 RepID=A0A9J6CSR6_POLVA|nr:hypothetical protein PVAND_013836 [Polypedilum vanderplanki]
MDVNQWKIVLFEWIKASEISNVYSFEQIQIEDLFNKFYSKLFDDTKDMRDENKIIHFLEENFPEYNILYNRANTISSQDYIYIFSILLYYSCVTQESEYFQSSCISLDTKFQMSIFSFFDFFNLNKDFSKESIRAAIKQGISMLSPQKSPQLFTTTSSPLVTPTKSNSQKTPTSTPHKEFFNETIKELRYLKTQLDNEKFEKSMLEIEMRQHQEKIQQLVLKCTNLSQDAQKMRNEMISEYQDENRSPNKSHRENHLRNKMQKEIKKRDDIIFDLKCENDNIIATNKRYKEKVTTMEKQLKDLHNKVLDLDASLNELRVIVELKNERIETLEKENRDYSDQLSYINETRSTCKDASSSIEMFEFSCSTYHTVHNSIAMESLGKSLLDIQLKEKENEMFQSKEKDSEMFQLKEMLRLANITKDNLEEKISSLAKTINVLENKLHEKDSNVDNEKQMNEMKSQLKLPILICTNEENIEKECGNVVITTSDIDDDDEENWVDDDESNCSKKRLSNILIRDKSYQREIYKQRQKQMRNKNFNNTRRRNSNIAHVSAENSSHSSLGKDDEH